MEYTELQTEVSTRKMKNQRVLLIGGLVGVVLVFIIGILIGRYAACDDDTKTIVVHDDSLVKEANPEISDVLMNNINPERIREHLRHLTERPHLAGTEGNNILARELSTFFKDAGFDHVTLTPYNVLLSYPNMSDLNYVELLDDKNVSQYKSALREPALTNENQSEVVPPFNAYSAPGDIHGTLVYVNYGRVEDYEHLETLNINISGKIAFARYGKIFRGDKVHLAEIRGAIGVILFSDPEDVTSGDPAQVYPKDWWLPPTGTQRGTILIGDGDPLTADYPAIETAYRHIKSDFYLSSIPCHPIGYGIAQHLMSHLAGDEVTEEWRGGMNVTYRYGNAFQNNGWKAHIHVSTHNQKAVVYNTIGTIRGEIEPDRYVLVGNHRDAWVFGAQDPSSGTAVMMEMAHVMGKLVKTGRWRPRRSIMFCSWGAEEYGLLGSTEWVEHYVKSLGARAVAYLNVDIAVEGNYSLEVEATPMTYTSLIAATKKVDNPGQAEVQAGHPTVYDTWMATNPDAKFGRPQISLPGAGSDYTPFRDRLGVPVFDIRFTWNRKYKVSSYPMYHSAYETFYLVDKIMDRGFKYHAAIGKIWTEVARDMADGLILPFNVTDYAVVLEDLGDTFVQRFHSDLEQHGIDSSLLTTAIRNFSRAAEDFKTQIQNVDRNNPLAIRGINDQLMNLNRAFLDPAGLPGRRLKRHILFAESSVDAYSGSSFPGLADALVEIRQGHDVDKQWKIVQEHFSVILFTIQSAASTLRNVTDFMYDHL